MTLWIWHLFYFWITITALCIAPFLFNPHQFSFGDFVIDYREFLRWLSRGNSKSHANSWIGYCRLSRTRITGFKKKRLGVPSEKLSVDVPRASIKTILISELSGPLLYAVIMLIAYSFVKSLSVPPINALLRIAVISLGPLAWNAVVLLVLFFISLFFGPMLASCCNKFGSVMAAIAHTLSVVGMVGFFEFLWYLERWDISHAVLGMLTSVAIQRFFLKFLIAAFLSREFKHDETNRAWWTGRWYGRGLGSSALTQPMREFIVKTVEMSLFAADFLCAHLLLFILSIPCFIPYFDRIHSTALFWLSPSKHIRQPIFSYKQRSQRRIIIVKYGILYALVFAFFAALIVLPVVFRDQLTEIQCSLCNNI